MPTWQPANTSNKDSHPETTILPQAVGDDMEIAFGCCGPYRRSRDTLRSLQLYPP